MMSLKLAEIFRELDQCNRNQKFRLEREKNLKKILTISTIIAVSFIMAFHIIDRIIAHANVNLYLWVRAISCTAFLINLGLAYYFKPHHVFRFFVYNGFYLCAIYGSIQTLISGGFQSPYWFSIGLILIVWFIFIPVTYRMLILHGLIFIVQHYIILFLFSSQEITFSEIALQMFPVIGIFFVGAISAITGNYSAKNSFMDQQVIIESESKYRNLVENATDGIIITRGEKILFVNRSFTNMMGYSENELIGKSIIDLIIPEDCKTITSIYYQQKDKDESKIKYDITGITKQGLEVPLEVSSTIIDYMGQPGTFTIVRDFSERLNAEKALKESEQRYRTIFNMAGDAIMIMRYKTGEFFDINDAACTLYGYSREEFLKLSNPDVSAEPETSMQYLHDNKGYVYIPERLHRRKDGSILIVEIMGNVFRINNEDFAISVVHDLTEKKKLEQELSKSYTVLEENYSHTLEQMQTYFAELQSKKSELLRLQKENLQSQFDTLKNQVNPHFLFNSLNILSSLISVNTELAEEFTGNLSKIYRYVLEHKSDDLVNLASELDFLHSYCFLLNIRFEGKLKFNIDIPSQYMQSKVLPMAIQILIENAIKHNSFSTKSPLMINIFVDNNNYLNIINNYQPRENRIASTGLGLTNIANRYSFFTEKETNFGIQDEKFIAKIPLL